MLEFYRVKPVRHCKGVHSPLFVVELIQRKLKTCRSWEWTLKFNLFFDFVFSTCSLGPNVRLPLAGDVDRRGVVFRVKDDLTYVVSEDKKPVPFCHYLRSLAIDRGIGQVDCEDHVVKPKMKQQDIFSSFVLATNCSQCWNQASRCNVSFLVWLTFPRCVIISIVIISVLVFNNLRWFNHTWRDACLEPSILMARNALKPFPGD